MIWWEDEIPPSWLLRPACLQAAWPAGCRWAHSMEVLSELQGRSFYFLTIVIYLAKSEIEVRN